MSSNVQVKVNYTYVYILLLRVDWLLDLIRLSNCQNQFFLNLIADKINKKCATLALMHQINVMKYKVQYLAPKVCAVEEQYKLAENATC